MKTVNLVRSHVYGTSRHEQTLRYSGFQYLSMPCAGHETIRAMLERAMHFGFTHVRFTGDWERYTVRKGMKIPQGPYVFKSPSLSDILSKATGGRIV